ERLPHAHGEAVCEAGRKAEPIGAEEHDDRRAHVEAANLGAASDGPRLLLEPDSRGAARDLAVRERADARDVQCADEHEDHRTPFGLEPADDALVAAEEPRDRGGRRATDAESRAGNVARSLELRVERRVHAVIIVRREIDREVASALEA